MRGSTQTVFTGDLVWKDGRTDIFPPILRAHSGWWYRPETVKGKKTFGMGSKGHEAANQFHAEMFYEVLRRHPNQHPIRIGNPRPTTESLTTNQSACLVVYEHPVYGQVELDFTVYARSYNRSATVSYQITFHRMLSVVADGETPDVWNRTGTTKLHRMEVEQENIESAIKQFQRDPWGVTTNKVALSQPLREALQPPDVLLEGQVEFHEEETNYDGVRTFASRQLRHHIGTEVRKIASERMQYLQELGKALQYFGVEINIRQTYGYGSEPQTITGLDVTIPPSNEKGNEEGHTFGIRADGITVDCGYVKQEQRYHQYEIEKAKQLLADKTFDVFEDFEYERNE